jgi:serine/threonine protein phosphatase PrpC
VSHWLNVFIQEDTAVVQTVDGDKSERILLAVFDGHGGDWAARQAEQVFPDKFRAAVQKQQAAYDANPVDEEEMTGGEYEAKCLLSAEQVRQVFSETDAHMRSLVDGDPIVRAKRLALCIELERWRHVWAHMLPRWQHYTKQRSRILDIRFDSAYYSRNRRLKDLVLAQAALHRRLELADTHQFSSRKSQPNWGVHAREEMARIEEEAVPLQQAIDRSNTFEAGYRAYTQAYMDHSVFVCDQVRRLKTEIQATFDGQTNRAGCTAATVEINVESGMLRTAHLGDSRVLVYSKEGHLRYWTEDHKPEDEEEQARIVRAGSEVNYSQPGCYRIDGNLNLSRALADYRYKACELLPEAEQPISGVPTTSEFCGHYLYPDDFVVVCCDGIFECNQFDNDSLGTALAACPKLQEDPESAALAILAQCAERPTHDNQKIIVLIYHKFTDDALTQANLAYARPVVYQPMAVCEPKTAFYFSKWSGLSTTFVDILAAECKRHGMSLREGLMRGIALIDGECNADVAELSTLLWEGIDIKEDTTKDDAHLAMSLKRHYSPAYAFA